MASLTSKGAAHRFLDFVNGSGSPYHSVAQCLALLKAKGFLQIHESSEKWELMKGGKYYFTRNHSEIFAFVVGGKVDVKVSPGFVMIGAHTDSPCLRIRPNSKQEGEGLQQAGVMMYGGGLWHTWFDRGLGFAGKVVVRESDNSRMVERLVRVNRPVMFIPNLAIHLQTGEERAAFKVSTEDHLQPILASDKYTKAHLGEEGASSSGVSRVLIDLIASELSVEASQISDFDLCLFDTCPAQLVGAYEEFVLSARIDNLLSTWACIDGLAMDASSLAKEGTDIYVATAFDHEECGSSSTAGADCLSVGAWLRKIVEGLSPERELSEGKFQSIMAKSILVSADGAHMTHPNYPAKHQKAHKIKAHDGIVFKSNANQRYASTCKTTALTKEVCRKANIPIQNFVVRNDSPCGSTIGPMLSSNLGIRTIDLGSAQWAMHSCRESCAVDDVAALLAFCRATYSHFREVDTLFVPLEENLK